MKKSLYLFLVVLIASATVNTARATHIAAAEITYAYTGTPNTWLLTMKAYRDCSGGTANLGQTASVCYASQSLAFGSTVVLQLAPGSGDTLPPSPCLPPTGQGQCYQEYMYQGLVTLPATAPDWVFSWVSCCRNFAINNIQNPGGSGVLIRSGLNSQVAPTNSSPVFSYIPINRFCIGNQFFYPQGAIDQDGDSLVFSLTDCEDYNGSCTSGGFTAQNIPWVAPNTAQQPFASQNGINFNTQTGMLTFIPTTQGVFNIAIQVDEYRNGIQIGYIRRDLQVNVVAACNNITPQFTNLTTITLPGGGTVDGITANCGDTVVRLFFTQKMQCGSIVPNDFRVTEPSGFPNPVIAANPFNCANGISDTVDVSLLNGLKAGISWIYTKVGNDGNTLITECGVEMAEFDSIPIYVVDNSVLVPPVLNLPSCDFDNFTAQFNLLLDCSTIATNLSDFTLTDSNGVNIPILSVSSNCQPGNPWSYDDTYAFTITPGNYTSPLILTVKTGSDGNTIANSCGTLLNPNDTLAIINFADYIPVSIGPDITICANDPAAVLTANVSVANYQWYLNGSAIAGATNPTHQATQTGTYSVVVSTSPTCAGNDTAEVTINPVPVVNLGPDTMVCVLAGYTLNAGSGATFQWLMNGSPISGANQQNYTPTQTGTFSAIVTNSSNCTDTGSVEITIVNQAAQPTPLDVSYCEGETIPPLDANVSNVDYQWFDGNNNAIPGETNQVFNPTGPGTYTVVVSINGGCTNQGTATVTENPTPEVTFSTTYPVDPMHNGIHICDEDDLEVTVTSNPGASSYVWTYTAVGGSATNLNNNTSMYLIPQYAYGEYEVEVTDVNGCVNKVHVEVEEECELVFYNVITPNGDGNNDVWVIENFDPSISHTLNIYNRWGNEVYSTSGYQNDWAGADLPHGVYYYVLNYNGEGYHGNITKIKREDK